MTLPRIIWDNSEVEAGTVTITASTTASGFPPQNVTDRREYTTFKTSGVGAQWWEIDFGAAKNILFLGIAGHNIASGGITNVNLTADNVGAGSPLGNVIIPNFTPTTDRAIGMFFTPANWRYWQLGFTVPGGGALEVGVIFLCTSYLEFPNLVESPFGPDDQMIFDTEGTGESGHLLGITEKFKQRDFTLNMMNQIPAWITSDFWPFFNSNGREPFFFKWDDANRANETSYVRIKNKDMRVPYNHVWQSFTLHLGGLYDAM